MDTTYVVSLVVSWATGWLCKEYFTAKPETLPCKCECACVQKTEGGNTDSNWIFFTCVIAVLVVLAANAALAFRITVTSSKGVQEVGFSVKGKSKGIYNPVSGLQLLG